MKFNKQWLVWKFISKPGDKKPRKVPYYINGSIRSGTQGSDQDRANLATFEDAINCAHSNGFEGVGFAFLPGDGFIGIDLDACITTDDQERITRAQKIIQACSSYTELTPSGNGYHIICRGQTETFKSNTLGIEVFCGSQFFTFTDNPIDGYNIDIAEINEDTLEKLRKTVKKTAPQPKPPEQSIKPKMPKPDAPHKQHSGSDASSVNAAAMANFDAWVPRCFPNAEYKSNKWRISSQSLGRGLEEDISISPDGIVDFGVADMGDHREGKRTPIELVAEHLFNSDWKKAADHLRQLFGMESFKATPKHLNFEVLDGPAPTEIQSVTRSRESFDAAMKLVEESENYHSLLETVIPSIRKLTGITELDIKAIAKRISLKATKLDSMLNRKDIEPMLITNEMRSINEARKAKYALMAKSEQETLEPAISEILSWTYIESDGGYFYNANDRRVVANKAFNLMYSAAPIPSADPDKKTPPDVFFISAGGDTAYNLIYMPDLYNPDDHILTYNGFKVLNTYKPLNIPEISQDWELRDSWWMFKDHLIKLFGEDAEMIINYLAHNVQFPGLKIRWGLLLKGQQGDGKTTISKVMGWVMGTNTVRVVSNEALSSAFNGWAFGACLLALEEVRLVGHSRHDVLNKLKPIVSNDVIEIVRKGKDGYEVPNVSNIIAMTNYEDALPVDQEDRRWGVAFTKFKSRAEVVAEMPEAYFDKLYANIEADPGSIRAWLLSIDLSGFNRHVAPAMTKGKQTMSEYALSDDAQNIKEYLSTEAKGMHKLCLDTQVLNCIIHQESGQKMMSSRISKALKQLGWVRFSSSFKVGGCVKTVYINANEVGDFESMTNENVRNYLTMYDRIITGSTGYSNW
jgi:hypothetical protein